MSKVSLKEVSDLITKGTTPSSLGCEFVSEGINFIKSESISGSKFLNSSIYEHIDEETDNKLKRSRLKNGDLLFSIAGAYLGKMAIVQPHDIPANTNQAVGIVRLNIDKANIDFIYYYFSQKSINSFINKLSSQSSQPNLNLDLLGKLEFEYKDLENQKSIAKILSDLDAKIEHNNRINAELEAMAKTLYNYWFVQFDFPDTNGKPYKSSGGKMVYCKELKREIPEGWRVGALDDIGSITGGSTPSKENDQYFCQNCGMSWITPKDLSLNKGNKFITRGEYDVTKVGIKSASLNIMPRGTVLLSSRAPIGYLAISRQEVTTNQGFKSFIPDKGYSTEFVYYTVKMMIPTIEKNAVGSTFKEISGTTLKTIKIVLPISCLLDSFDKKVGSIFKRQDLLELENEQLVSLRDWLLPMLMNGQVKVADCPTEGKVYQMNDAVSMAAEAER